MNIYQRPMFRQSGGPMDAAPDVQSQLQQVEQQAASDMEQVGADYVTNMMQSLDSAEDAEGIINAIRGNQRPLQERYAELGTIVGEDDARATPESVLALVQPTIMMTEQGVIDSGIGELMQNIAGSVDMETDSGQPTAMGSGIGELMMQGQPEPQQYRYGGPVRLAPGGDVYTEALKQFGIQSFDPMLQYDTQVQQGYETRLPLYESVMGGDQAKKLAQSGLFFDIARAGLNLAGGVDPATGQSMTNLPLAAQLARAATPVATSAQEAGQAVQRAEIAPRLAALQAAEAQERARIEQVGRERQGAQQQAGQGALTGLNAFFTDIRDKSLAEQQQDLARLQSGFNINEINATYARRMEELNESNEARALLQTQIDSAAFQRLIRDGEIRTDITNLDNKAALNRLIEQGEINKVLQTMGDDARMQLQEIIGTQELNRLIEQGKINRDLQTMGDEARMRLQELIGTQSFNELLQVGAQREASIRLQAEQDRITQAERAEQNLGLQRQIQAWQGSQNKLDRQQGNDQFLAQLKLNRDKLEATAGDPQGFAESILEFWNWGEPQTAFENAVAMAQQDSRQAEINNMLRFQMAEADRALQDRNLSLRDRQTQTEFMLGLMKLQENYQSRFGTGLSQRTQALIADPNIMQAYGSGLLDQSSPELLTTLEAGLSEYLTPKYSYNPQTGAFMEETRFIPRALQSALNSRRDSGLAPPFGFYGGGPVMKMQKGGNPNAEAWAKFDDLTSGDRSRTAQLDEDIELSGRIVDPSVDVSKSVGLFSPVKDAFRGLTSYAGDIAEGVGLDRPSSVFAEESVGSSQLQSLANVTQRFVRESVAGRALKDEIEKLAKELVEPGMMTKEKAQANLTSMRNQLLEIQDLAQSMLETPERFSAPQVQSARQDLRNLQPLLDNYDTALSSFERRLQGSKPDPAMFDRSLQRQ